LTDGFGADLLPCYNCKNFGNVTVENIVAFLTPQWSIFCVFYIYTKLVKVLSSAFTHQIIVVPDTTFYFLSSEAINSLVSVCNCLANIHLVLSVSYYWSAK